MKSPQAFAQWLLLTSITLGLSGCLSAAKTGQAKPALNIEKSSVGVLKQSYGSSSDFELNWMDRRPIGMIFLAPVSGAGAIGDGFAPNNPRGWFNDHSININNQAGLKQLQTRVLAYADSTIQVLKNMNAQGAVVWDAEGEEYPQDTTYLGDPTAIESIAPEWDSVVSGTQSSYDGMLLIDAYFKKYKDAGLKLGLTLRPQTLEIGNTSDCGNRSDVYNTCQPFSIDTGTQQQAMQKKITFAKNRWGVSIFYVDSNVLADQYWRCQPSECNNDWTKCPVTCPSGNQMLLSNGKSRLGGLPFDANFFSGLAEANPDVLIIPEHHWGFADGSHGDYFKSVSPLYQLFQDYGSNPAHTPDDEYAAVPGVFSTIIVNNSGLSQGDTHYNQLVQGVNRGDILMARAMYNEPDQDLIKSIYLAAANLPVIARVIPGTAVHLFSVASGSAVLTWTTSEGSSSQVQYGVNTNYGLNSSLDSNLVQSHSVTLNGLQPSTLYHFKVKSNDVNGNAAASSDYTFTTTNAQTGTVITIANSVSEYGSAQAQNHWSYGQYTSAHNFSYSTLAWNGSTWIGTDVYGTPNISSSVQHPGCGSNGYNGLPTVRRWTNPGYGGVVTLSGSVSKSGTGCGDGTLNEVVVNGSSRYSVALNANDTAGSSYSFNYTATPGDTVDLVTSAQGDCFCDATNFNLVAITQSVTSTPTPAPTATPSSTPAVLGDSVADFGASQKYKNWEYGQYSNSQTFSYSSLSWTGSTWLGTDAYGTPNIGQGSQHPGCGTNGTDGLATVRRFTNTMYAGQVRVSGSISKANTSCGDGTSNSVRVNGVTKYNLDLNYNDQNGANFSFNFVVAPGDVIDMVTEPRGNCFCDETNFTLNATVGPL